MTHQPRLPMAFGHFLPWYTLKADAHALKPEELSTIPTPLRMMDNRHWQDSGSGYRRSHLGLPKIGRYDSRDPQTIRWQIEQAKAAGLAGFIINWYGQNSIENVITLAVLREFERWNRDHPDDPILYFLSIDSQAQLPTEGKTPVSLEQDLQYIRKRLIRAGYLLHDGQPVLTCFPYQENISDWLDAISSVFGAEVPDFLWMNEPCGKGEAGCFLWVQPDPATIDLTSSYTWNDPDNIGGDWAVQQYARWSNKHLEHRYGMAGIWPGFNDTLVTWAWKPETRHDKARPRIIARETDKGNTYARMWDIYLNAIRDPAILPLPLVQIVTWNDWAEDTAIEPSRDYEQKYIDLTKEYVGKAQELWQY